MPVEAIPTVGVVVFRNEEVLLVRNNAGSQHIDGVHGLPAGRVDSGETNEIAARRELREETGLEAKEVTELPQHYLAELTRKTGEKVLMSWIVFLCREYSGELRPKNDETTPIWVNRNNVKDLPLSPNTENAIKQALTLLPRQ